MKRFICGIIIGAILSGSVCAFAYSEETINAIFGKIKLFVDGKEVVRETLLYNGTTYVPLRDAAEMLGKAVTYDANTYSAYIGIAPQISSNKVSNKYYDEVPWALDVASFTNLILTSKIPSETGCTYTYTYNNSSDGDGLEDYSRAVKALGFEYMEATDSICMFTKIENGVGYDIMFTFLSSERKIIVTAETFVPKNTSQNTTNSPTITLDEFNKIRKGMTYSEVVGIIGGYGEQVSESSSGDYTITMYMWHGDDYDKTGANANILFTNGEVDTKAQFGLK